MTVRVPFSRKIPTRGGNDGANLEENIPGYSYGRPEIDRSPISLAELDQLKISAGFTAEDELFLRMAGEVLTHQVEQIVNHWRKGIIASIPHLAKHSQTPKGQLIPEYLEKSNLRFQKWILDTCSRPYDQDWLNYQNEIALRHTSLKKNQTDHVNSTPYVPFSDIVAFISVINETIKPYLAAVGHSPEVVERMHLAWSRSMQLQMALWVRPYMDANRVVSGE